MQALRDLKKESAYTEAVLSGLTDKQLRQLRTWNGVATFQDAVVAKLVKDLGYEPRDRVIVNQYGERRALGLIFEAGRFEEVALRNGTTVEYSEKQVHLTFSDNEKKAVVNSVIPQPPSVVPRPYLNAITCLFGQFLIYRDGRLQNPVDPLKFSEAWSSKKSPIDSSKIELLRAQGEEIIRADDSFKAMTDTQRNNLTEVRWNAFLMRSFNNCSIKDYLSLHHMACYQFVRYFKFGKDGVTRYKVKKQLVVPDAACVPIDEDTAPANLRIACKELRAET
jgi:hypothetical protein